MLSRFYFSSHPQNTASGPNRAPQKKRRQSVGVWLILIGLTAFFFLWLSYRWLIQPGWPDALPTLFQESLELVEVGLAFTLALVWIVLYWRYRRANSSHTRHTFTLEQLFELSPQAFEQYVAGLFRQKGYQVTMRGRSGDHGVDLELFSLEGKKAVVQCKRYQNTVGEEFVRELYGTLIHERAARAFLVTTADISESGRQWAQGKPITLIDGNTLVQITEALAADQTQQVKPRWPRFR